jgi:hypothetical protein
MLIGSSLMIYLEITAESSHDETSDAIKKLILNYLQILSLAGGLPLHWPAQLTTMFDGFDTLSSAGSTLLIPDCELTEMKTADAFYMKQIFYTLLVPFIVIFCTLSWTTIAYCCAKKRRVAKGKHGVQKKNVKDYTILSCVLMVFLSYPMLARLSFSMLKCPYIGDQPFLMADLEEPCFVGRHWTNLLLLTLPQVILYVVGLPVVALTIILRNKKHLHEERFLMRYGLLYHGYRDDRAWWEIVIAFRKVAVVCIGTFGTLWGVVDLQAFTALAVIFLSIVIHLVGKPFDTEKPNGRLLHNMEFAALTICWSTFWGGLLFFLGHEQLKSVNEAVLGLTNVVLLLANVLFLFLAGFIFFREYVKDKKAARRRRSTALMTANQKLQIFKAGMRIGVSSLSKVMPVPLKDENDEGKIVTEETRNWGGDGAPELFLEQTA